MMVVFSRLVSIPLDMQHAIENLLDIPALLALGGTSLYFRDRVSDTLKRERNTIIRQYWPEPELFLEMLSLSRAVISGEAALAFVMRDRSLLTKELEVCVSRLYAEDLIRDLEANNYVARIPCDEPPTTFDHTRTTTFEYKNKYDDVIRVFCSHTDSPLTPIASYPTTALFNYMDQFSFGCAYRDLTLNRRGRRPDIHPAGEAPAARARVDRIVAQDFIHSEWPAVVAFPAVPFVLEDLHAVWNNPDHPQELVNTVCLRPMYQCPGQARFFGDPGSLVDFFKPDMVDHGIMAHNGYAPYGPMAVWRMQGPDCDYQCANVDCLLPEGVMEICSIGKTVRMGPFLTGVIGRIAVGPSQQRHVWNTSIHDIKLKERGVLWGTNA